MKKYDLVAVTGKYTDRDGNEKSRYINCGAVFENERGNLSMKLESVPVGEWNGWFSLFEPKPKGGGDSYRAASRGGQSFHSGSTQSEPPPFEDDDIPFD